jgi:hypothetical protein
VGDAAEAVVDTATEVAEEVTESASDAADAGLDALRDGAASAGPALGAIANVVLGVVKGAVHAVADLAAMAFDVVRNVGKLVSDVLHLNLADIIADLEISESTFCSSWFGGYVWSRAPISAKRSATISCAIAR